MTDALVPLFVKLFFVELFVNQCEFSSQNNPTGKLFILSLLPNVEI